MSEEKTDLSRVREAGAETMEGWRRQLRAKAAQVISKDPDAARLAAEMGLVDRRWLEQPDRVLAVNVTPIEVLERFFERSADRRPSLLTRIGLTGLQLVAGRAVPSQQGLTEATIAFTDIEGFTAYTESNGDESALRLVEQHNKAARSVVRQWQGRVVKTLGDGLLCVFPDAESAVRAALELVHTVPAPLKLRAGLHSGQAVLTKDDVIGQAVNIAARVTEHSTGGTVMVTAQVLHAMGDVPGVLVGRARQVKLKGISERFELHEVTEAPSPSIPGRRAAPFPDDGV